MDTCSKKNESGTVIFGFPAHLTLPALLMEGWRHPDTSAVKMATSPRLWKPPCRSRQVGEGASLRRDTSLIWGRGCRVTSEPKPDWEAPRKSPGDEGIVGNMTATRSCDATAGETGAVRV